MTPLTCGEMHDLAPELALGLLTGAERAAALTHLEGCAPCRSDVASLTDVGEAVLALAPEVPPSAGFETRVLSRMGPPRAARPGRPDRSARRRWARPAAAVAALVLVVAAVAGALTVVGGGGSGDAVAAAELRTPSARVVGQATVRGADPATVTVEMDGWLDELRRYGRTAGHSWWLRVGTRDGGEEAYALPVAESDPWHVTLDDQVGGGAVTSVAVVDETGHAWCEARFAGGAAQG